MPGYPKRQPREERMSARLGARAVFGAQPRECHSAVLSLRREVCGVGAFAGTKKKRTIITKRKSCLKPECDSPPGVRSCTHTSPAGGPVRQRKNAQRPSSCHTSEGAPETIPLNLKFLGGFLRVFCPSCVVPVVIFLGDERAGKKRCSRFSRD